MTSSKTSKIFEENVLKTETCWLWKGARQNAKGYGSYFGRSAHRVAYEHYVGEIPDGLHVLHSCDVRNCVNPSHLRLVSNEENIEYNMKRGRYRTPSSMTERVPCEKCGRLTQRASYMKHFNSCKGK
jgi:hypothetical protein